MLKGKRKKWPENAARWIHPHVAVQTGEAADAGCQGGGYGCSLWRGSGCHTSWRWYKSSLPLLELASVVGGTTQSILPEQGEEMCPSRALRQAEAPAAGRQLLGKHLVVEGLQGWTPHSSSRQDFHSLERKTCIKNSTVSKTKGCFSIITRLLSEFSCCNFYCYFFEFEACCVIIALHLKIRKELSSSQPQLHRVRFYLLTVLASISNVSFFF